MKNLISVLLAAAGAIFPAARGASAGCTPETSPLFEKVVEPESGVVSYSLTYGKPGDNRQSLSFTTKSMTEDGRFLLFYHTDAEGNDDARKKPKTLMVADLQKNIVRPVARTADGKPATGLPGYLITGEPFVETKENYIVFGTSSSGLWRCDLAEPDKARKLCDVPKELRAMGRVHSIFTHLTLTRDRRRAFLDAQVDPPGGKRRYVQGMVDLATGAFDIWGETPFYCNHGQLCPADDTLAMCAWEACWEPDGKAYKNQTGWYPRMWLVRKGWRKMIPAKERNFASHEIWDDDGKGFSWCGLNDFVYHHDLATGRQERWCGVERARHATLSPDNKYVVCNECPQESYNGKRFIVRSWRAAFWNRETGKRVWILASRPALRTEHENSPFHLCPLPRFVMNGRYIVLSAGNADGHMDLWVTPVAQLIEKTR